MGRLVETADFSLGMDGGQGRLPHHKIPALLMSSCYFWLVNVVSDYSGLSHQKVSLNLNIYSYHVENEHIFKEIPPQANNPTNLAKSCILAIERDRKTLKWSISRIVKIVYYSFTYSITARSETVFEELSKYIWSQFDYSGG